MTPSLSLSLFIYLIPFLPKLWVYITLYRCIQCGLQIDDGCTVLQQQYGHIIIVIMATRFNEFVQEIEMSSRGAWTNAYKFRQTPQITEIKPSIITTIFRILREDQPYLPQPRQRYSKSEPLIYINPLSVSISVWNILIIFVAYFLCFQISLTLGFGPQWWHNQLEKAFFHFAYVLLLALLAIDAFINFHKGYYAFGQGKVIDDKNLIIRRYLRSYFIPDLICIGLLIIPLFENDYLLNFLQIVSIVLLFVKKFKCQAEIVKVLEYSRNGRVIFILTMLGCDVMLLGNFGACIFLGLDLLLWRLQFFDNNPQYFWLSNNSSYSVDLMGGSWLAQYVYAQSFSTGTLSTLAPGPFGKNPIQISFELFVMIFFMILASYVGEVLVSILYGREKVRIFHENNIQKFDNYMSLKNVVAKIKGRVHNFFELIWEFEIKTDAEGEQKIVEKLPLSLQEDLVSQLGCSYQLKFPMYFKKHYSDLQKIISFKIISTVVDPDATIFEIGSPLDTVGEGYIIYIKNGLAKYYFPFDKKNNIISLSNTQKLMGELEFVTGLSHSFCCKSIDLSVIQKIAFSEFMNLLKGFDLMEQFAMLKCRVMYYNELYLLQRNCMICDKRHRQSMCPSIFITQQLKQQLKYEESLTRIMSPNQYRHFHIRKSWPSKKRLHPAHLSQSFQKLITVNSQQSTDKTGKHHHHNHSRRKNIKNEDINSISDQVNIYLVYYCEFNVEN